MMTQFVGNLACPIEFGNSIVIAGKTIDGAQRTQINLRANKEAISNIGLHLSIRFDEEIIIRNTLINNEWGEEERSEHLYESTSPNPLVPGDFFIVHIFASDEKFHISVNHRPFCTFKYRLSIEQLITVEVRDHLQAVTQIDHRTAFPSPWPPLQYSDPHTVFSNDSPILFTPGHVIVITALPYHDENGRFFVLFMDGDSKREALHFNVRFNPQNVVVRNAMKDNYEFGPEERDGGFPFRFNQQFRLAIAFTKNAFLFAVDGRRFCTFAYRKSRLLDTLTGFIIKTNNGMRMQVTSVDHLTSNDMDCSEFEKYSNPRFVIM